MIVLFRFSFDLVVWLKPLSLLLESLWTQEADDGTDDIVDDPRHDGAGLWSNESIEWLQLEQSVAEQQQEEELALPRYDILLSSTCRDL